MKTNTTRHDMTALTGGRARRRAAGVLGLLLALAPAPLSAQEASTIVEFEPFDVEGIGVEEGMMIEDLVRDYVKKIDRVLLVFPGVEDVVPRPDIDYVMSGRIYAEDESYILQLDVTDTRREKTNTWVSSYRTSSDMALKVPTINYSSLLGEASARAREGAEGAPEEPRIEQILGRWRAGDGIEQVFFLRNGEARAYFSSGAAMELRYRVEGGLLVVEQKSPNNARYYQGLGARAAAALAEVAEPMRWELSSYNRGQVLRGRVFETSADFDGTELTGPRRATSRPVEWNKGGR